MAGKLTIKRQSLLCVLCFFASLTASATTQPLSAKQAQAQESRTARLEELGRAWGVVKLFHPRLAWSGIDWDRALIDAIPKVNAAHGSQEYVAAINSMFSALHDPNTRVRIHGNVFDTNPAHATPATGGEPVRLAAGLLVIDESAAANSSQRPGTPAPGLADKVIHLLPNAKAILLDLRAVTRLTPADAFARESLLSQVLPELLDQDVTLASQRYRGHSGHAPQRGDSSGGYYSGLVTQTPTVLIGRSKAKTPPIIILVNANSVSLPEIIGLRSAGIAYVVQEGVPPSDMSSATIELGHDVELTISTAEWVDPRGTVGFFPDEVVATGQVPSAVQRAMTWNNRPSDATQPSASQAPSNGKDNAYPEMAFPAYEYRLLALFRYWNAINYFFPYKDLIGGDWSTVLPSYIPRFEAAKNEYEYEVALRELTTEIHDSHGFMGPTKAFADQVGAFTLPVALRHVEGQSMVDVVFDANTPLHVGDVILSVDGQSMVSRREYFAKFYSASTPQASTRLVEPFLLRGQKNSQARLTVLGIDGAIHEVRVGRTMDAYSPSIMTAFKRTTPPVAILSGGVGYVDLDRLEVKDVDRMFETIKTTQATIFDMRGYPSGTAWKIAPRLSKAKNPVAALFSRPMLTAVALGDEESGASTYQFQQFLPDAPGQRYGGQIVVLINENAASQAEHTCLFFEAATDVTFIGTPTLGVDGDVTNVVLPGGISASFSGHAVRHADGRQLQRVGIQPSIRVAPTIAGIAAGRDEVLEAALQFLAKQPVSNSQ
jgi:C-terminal processing protease CtpA/Prc